MTMVYSNQCYSEGCYNEVDLYFISKFCWVGVVWKEVILSYDLILLAVHNIPLLVANF